LHRRPSIRRVIRLHCVGAAAPVESEYRAPARYTRERRRRRWLGGGGGGAPEVVHVTRTRSWSTRRTASEPPGVRATATRSASSASVTMARTASSSTSS
jgi:aminoglycoside phosphotransferase